MEIKQVNEYSPIMNVCTAAFAAVNFNGEQEEQKEETGHSKTDFVHCRVSHQLLAHLTRLNTFAHLLVEGNLESTTYDKLLDRSQASS